MFFWNGDRGLCCESVNWIALAEDCISESVLILRQKATDRRGCGCYVSLRFQEHASGSIQEAYRAYK